MHDKITHDVCIFGIHVLLAKTIANDAFFRM
jgi:hypothetical protein